MVLSHLQDDEALSGPYRRRELTGGQPEGLVFQHLRQLPGLERAKISAGVRVRPTRILLGQVLKLRARFQLSRAAVRSLQSGDQTLRRWTRNQLDMRAAVFLMLLAGGVYQLLRGRLNTPAPTLLWYAGDLLGLWSNPPATAAASGERTG